MTQKAQDTRLFENTPVKFLRGVGEARAKLLESELQISTFGDLLGYFPFRYIDRSRFYRISEFSGEMPHLQVKGWFTSFSVEGEGRKRRLRGVFTDGFRMMEVVWFAKIDTIRGMYHEGIPYIIFGKPVQFNNSWSMTHPEIDRYDEAKPPAGFQGVYSLTDSLRKRGIGQRTIQGLVRNLLDNAHFKQLGETLPPTLVARLNLMPRAEAMLAIHFPDGAESLRRARERMKFEELFYLEMQILRYAKKRNLHFAGHVLDTIGKTFNGFYSNCIPFELTGAQKRVLREIRSDMRTGRQMNRLLQGDVGSGKTMVAFMSMLMAVDNGLQACMMAPTEILSRQHYDTLRKWGDAVGVRVEILTGTTRQRQRREILEDLAEGKIDILIGTHALIEDRVEFKNLGLAVVDEQHRFGVAQRARLWGKGTTPPHVLVMTATPIPRTLAMTLYGDLDVSVIDELPPGRKPIETYLMGDSRRGSVNRLIRAQIQEGRQVYIVFPLIHENAKLALKSLEEGLQRVREWFPDVEVSFVHGQLKPDEKEYQMQKFVEGKSRILAATTVIEVGVNVPNATVMVIENAERFGLSQLHQLRGRVGRGADKSWCILMSKDKLGALTKKRLSVMTETTDGFLLSEADLKLRGPGDMEGTQQSGIAFNLKVANLSTDGAMVQFARKTAEEILASNPEIGVAEAMDALPNPEMKLSHAEISLLAGEMKRRFEKSADWSVIS